MEQRTAIVWIPLVGYFGLTSSARKKSLAIGMKVLFAVMLLASATTVFGSVDLSGSMAAGSRVFIQDKRYHDQSDGNDHFFYLQPELRYEASVGRITMVPFYRYDGIDDERTHFDIRELNWRYFTDRWDLLVGIDRVFWGVTESRHLVDIINQTDLVENIDQESKLGQPMVRFNWLSDFGNVTAFIMPRFRERTFPGTDGRLRTAIPVSNDRAVYESSDNDSHIDLALRYSNVFGDWDVGAYYFSGTGREPRLMVDMNRRLLIPYYDLIRQLGVDVQLTAESWLWKFEAINRSGQGKTFAAAVAGFEYTWYQVADSDVDLGLLVELIYDGRDESAPGTLLDRDAFFGLRLGMNDIDDSELLAGLVYDPEKQQQMFTLEGKRRLTQHWSVELETWLFNDSDSARLDFSQDDYVQLQFVWSL